MEDFDRAHPRIQDRVLRIIDEGVVTDTRGHSADVSNAIFIFNVHVPESKLAGRIGFGSTGDVEGGADVLGGHDESLAKRVGSHLDDVVIFRSLARPSSSPASEILERHIESFRSAMLEEYKIEISLDEALQSIIAERLADASNAHGIADIVEALLYDPVTRALLDGATGKQLELKWVDDAVVIHTNQDEPEDDCTVASTRSD
jgi:ATP-dependent Clp protease ATP-binding subunit ClpA